MTHGSLFSGIGGFDLAAQRMGWTNAFHCEINDFCSRILKYHFPEAIHYEDITKTDFSEWRGRIDILSGGFPCQPFSLAGRRKGAEDDRYLWPHMLRAIHEIRPAWVVGENVAGILTMVQPGEEVEVGSGASLFGESDRKRVLLRQEYVIETLCRDLEREGYEVRPFVIPACAVGAPHRRDRVWIVARLVADIYGDGGQAQAERQRGKTEKTDEQPQSVFNTADTPHASDSGIENQRGRQDGVHAVGTASDPDNDREPSPKVGREAEGGGRRHTLQPCERKYSIRPWGLMDCMDFYGMLLTPSASDGVRANLSMENLKNHNRPNAENSNLAEQIAHKVGGGTSRLNPLFVEEMMGFPLMWTALPFLSPNGGRNP